MGHNDRYKVVKEAFWWRVRIGDGQQVIGKCHTETEAERLAAALTTAFRDGEFTISARVAELEAHNETRNIELLASVQQCAQLKAQLADHKKLLLLAKDALEEIDTLLPCGIGNTALAAINNSKLVERLILCDAEPVGEVEAIDVDDDAQPSAWVCINTDIELGTPLYSPRRTEK